MHHFGKDKKCTPTNDPKYKERSFALNLTHRDATAKKKKKPYKVNEPRCLATGCSSHDAHELTLIVVTLHFFIHQVSSSKKCCCSPPCYFTPNDLDLASLNRAIKASRDTNLMAKEPTKLCKSIQKGRRLNLTFLRARGRIPSPKQGLLMGIAREPRWRNRRFLALALSCQREDAFYCLCRELNEMGRPTSFYLRRLKIHFYFPRPVKKWFKSASRALSLLKSPTIRPDPSMEISTRVSNVFNVTFSKSNHTQHELVFGIDPALSRLGSRHELRQVESTRIFGRIYYISRLEMSRFEANFKASNRKKPSRFQSLGHELLT